VLAEVGPVEGLGVVRPGEHRHELDHGGLLCPRVIGSAYRS
jgi:hypothetical protein